MKKIAITIFAFVGMTNYSLAKDIAQKSNLDKLKNNGQLEVIKIADPGKKIPTTPVVCVSSCYQHEDKNPNEK